jgi:hypothetical protein
VLDHILVGDIEAVQDDDLVVEPRKVRVGVDVIPDESPNTLRWTYQDLIVPR